MVMEPFLLEWGKLPTATAGLGAQNPEHTKYLQSTKHSTNVSWLCDCPFVSLFCSAPATESQMFIDPKCYFTRNH